MKWSNDFQSSSNEFNETKFKIYLKTMKVSNNNKVKRNL